MQLDHLVVNGAGGAEQHARQRILKELTLRCGGGDRSPILQPRRRPALLSPQPRWQLSSLRAANTFQDTPSSAAASAPVRPRTRRLRTSLAPGPIRGPHARLAVKYAGAPRRRACSSPASCCTSFRMRRRTCALPTLPEVSDRPALGLDDTCGLGGPSCLLEIRVFCHTRRRARFVL